MKLAICARILLGAAATLAAGAARADQFGGPGLFQNPRYRTAWADRAATSRVRGTTVTSDTSSLEGPEADAAPAPTDEKPTPEPDTLWDEEGPGCGDCCPIGPVRHGMWYGSVDYLLMRPRLSQGVAEVRRTLTTNDNVSPETSTLSDRSVEFPFSYQSAFRASLGYRLLDCGGDLQLSYWRMTSDARYSDGPADTINDNPTLLGQLENDPGNDGFLSASTGITANIFDVDFTKCLSLGGPQDPCDACFCPRWDLRWWAGARVADISRYDNNVTTTPIGSIAPTDRITTGNIDARFVGAGPRVGMQGRRYFGPSGFLSLYARASQALLIGDYRMSRIRTTEGDEEIGTETLEQFDRFSRMVPVTDIEVGGSWQIAPFTYVSVGYFFQCWWDLGQSEGVIGSNFGPLDTANILGFDGLFVRAELLF